MFIKITITTSLLLFGFAPLFTYDTYFRNGIDKNMTIMNNSNHPPTALRGEQRRSSICCASGSGFQLSDRVIRSIFLLLGVGILIPWNAFVSATPYFASRLCEKGRDIVNFEQWFGLVWNVASVISLGLIIVGQCKS